MAKKYLDNVGLGRMWNRIKAYLTNNYAAKSHTHTIAQITNLQTTLDGKANKATTLAGYGITDAYTKTESDGRYYRPAANRSLSGILSTTSETVALAAMDNHTVIQNVSLSVTGSPRRNRTYTLTAPSGGTYYVENARRKEGNVRINSGVISGGGTIMTCTNNDNISISSGSFRIFRMS